jgi:hypothetical protein
VPTRQLIARQAFYAATVLAFLAALGLAGYVETAGQW